MSLVFLGKDIVRTDSKVGVWIVGAAVDSVIGDRFRETLGAWMGSSIAER